MKNNMPAPLHRGRGGSSKPRRPESERKQQGIVTVLKTRQTTTAPRKQGTPSLAATVSPPLETGYWAVCYWTACLT